MKRMYKKIIILLIFCMSLIGGQRLLIGDNGLIFTSAEENRNMSQETVISSLAEDVTTFWIHFSDGETIIDSQEVVYGTMKICRIRFMYVMVRKAGFQIHGIMKMQMYGLMDWFKLKQMPLLVK